MVYEFRMLQIPEPSYFHAVKRYESRVLQIPEPSYFHAVEGSCRTASNVLSSSLKKKTSVSIKN